MIAEVIINTNAISLNKNLDYIVPKKLEESVKIGNRVFVPLRNKKEEGYIINLKETSSYATKEIIKIEDTILTEEDTYYITSTPGVKKVSIEVIAANQYAYVQIDTSAKELRENTISYTLPDGTKIVSIPIVIKKTHTDETYFIHNTMLVYSCFNPCKHNHYGTLTIFGPSWRNRQTSVCCQPCRHSR